MLSRVLAWVLLCVGIAAVSAPATARQVKPTPVRQIAREVTCSFVPLTAKAMGIPLCPGTAPGLQEVADTIPGTPGVPSSQVITVQGCSGCISTGSGGGSGSFPYTGVFGSAYGQTGTAASYVGIAGFDYANSNTDALTVAPFGGNGSGTGYPAAYGQPGVLVVQGGLQGGAIGISGNLGAPYSAATAQPTTPASFMGIGGTDGTNYHPVSVGANGAVSTSSSSLNVVTQSVVSGTPLIIPLNGNAGLNFTTSNSVGATLTWLAADASGTYAGFPCTQIGGFSQGVGGFGTSSSTATSISLVCNVGGYSSFEITSNNASASTISYTLTPQANSSFLIVGGGNVVGQQTPGQSQSTRPGVLTDSQGTIYNSATWDPVSGCSYVSAGYATAQLNITSATTTTLVALSGSKKIQVCSYSFTLSGTTTPTAQFEYSTSSSCASGLTPLTGPYTGVSASSLLIANPPASNGIQFTALGGDSLCLVTGGTAPAVNGFITYIQN